MQNKLASSFVVSLGKALNGIPHLFEEGRWPTFPSKARVGGRKDIRP